MGFVVSRAVRVRGQWVRGAPLSVMREVARTLEERRLMTVVRLTLSPCGHAVERVVLAGKRPYRPRRLWCEVCTDENARKAGVDERFPLRPPRARTAVIPPVPSRSRSGRR